MPATDTKKENTDAHNDLSVGSRFSFYQYVVQVQQLFFFLNVSILPVVVHRTSPAKVPRVLTQAAVSKRS